jgi:pimeloyl-ACP methyl ester carboxylesterase
MENDLKIGESDIIVGHSSGACAAIRFAEIHPGKVEIFKL